MHGAKSTKKQTPPGTFHSIILQPESLVVKILIIEQNIQGGLGSDLSGFSTMYSKYP